MKKLSLVLALFMAALGTVNAQDNKSASAAANATAKKEVKATEATARRQTDELDRLVGLTDSQKESVYNMNLTLAHRAEIINNGGSADKAKVLKEIETFRETTIMQQLNDEQRAKYKASAGR